MLHELTSTAFLTLKSTFLCQLFPMFIYAYLNGFLSLAEEQVLPRTTTT